MPLSILSPLRCWRWRTIYCRFVWNLIVVSISFCIQPNFDRLIFYVYFLKIFIILIVFFYIFHLCIFESYGSPLPFSCIFSQWKIQFIKWFVIFIIIYVIIFECSSVVGNNILRFTILDLVAKNFHLCFGFFFWFHNKKKPIIRSIINA